VFWNDIKNGWYYSPLSNRENQSPFLTKDAAPMKRFGNFFELSKDALGPDSYRDKKTIF
jgi:hypothetical protein